MKQPHIHSGMLLRDAESVAADLGATVEQVRATGEHRMRHPALSLVVVYNCRKKTASRAVTVWLRRLAQALAGASNAV